MKNLFLITAITVVTVINFSFAQIPNNGFENWINMGTYENPDGWGTMNNTTSSGGIYTATKGTPGFPGAAYLILTSELVGGSVVNAIAVSGKLDSISKQPVSGFAFDQRPQILTGEWQHMIFGTSQGSVSAKLTRWDTLTNSRETVATAYQTLVGMDMSWTSFTVNFVYQTGNYPDTCIIVFRASGLTAAAFDYLYIDNLAFTGTVAGIEKENNFLNNLKVYSNPSNQTININFNLKAAGKMTFELIDLTGKIIFSKTASLLQGESSQIIDISVLAKGVYLVRIGSENVNETRKITIQ